MGNMKYKNRDFYIFIYVHTFLDFFTIWPLGMHGWVENLRTGFISDLYGRGVNFENFHFSSF